MNLWFVAQVSNLLYRRFPIGSARRLRTVSGLEIRDTADRMYATTAASAATGFKGAMSVSMSVDSLLPPRQGQGEVGREQGRMMTSPSAAAILLL